MTTENSKDNLQIWNAVKQTPSNFLKKIEFGYLKGKSDINPQWRLMAMTQAFGPVGHGWTYRIVKLWCRSLYRRQCNGFCRSCCKDQTRWCLG